MEPKPAAPGSRPQNPETGRERTEIRPKRLYLRLPSREDPLWAKAENLVEIFGGGFPVAFYDAAEKKYEFSVKPVALSEYLLREFKSLLGEENVILK